MGRPRKVPPLTESEWAEVFRVRCISKRGGYLPPDKTELCRRAFLTDPVRYAKLEREVFEATKPFGA